MNPLDLGSVNKILDSGAFDNFPYYLHWFSLECLKLVSKNELTNKQLEGMEILEDMLICYSVENMQKYYYTCDELAYYNSMENPLSAALRHVFVRQCTRTSARCVAFRIQQHGLEENLQINILKDIFEDLFKTRILPTGFSVWHNNLIPNLATTIYKGNKLGDMGILADTLEEYGFSEEIVRYCRRGTHIRCNWLLERLRRGE